MESENVRGLREKLLVPACLSSSLVSEGVYFAAASTTKTIFIDFGTQLLQPSNMDLGPVVLQESPRPSVPDCYC